MPFFAKVLALFQTEIEIPKMYGGLHLAFVALIIAASVLLCVFFRDAKDKTYRRIVLISWILIAVLEVYKQITYTYSFDGTAFVADYRWYVFPYQLCSTPLYIMPFAALLKDGRVRDAMMVYLATFSFFGGLAVILYPGDILTYYLGISIQSLIHHGVQVVIGIYTAAYLRKRYDFKLLLHALPVFAVLVTIALVMNIGVYHAFTAAGIGDTFNMFFVSPYFDCTLPVLSMIYPLVPYVVFVAIYILGFCFVSYLMFLIQKGVTKLAGGIRVKIKG